MNDRNIQTLLDRLYVNLDALNGSYSEFERKLRAEEKNEGICLETLTVAENKINEFQIFQGFKENKQEILKLRTFFTKQQKNDFKGRVLLETPEIEKVFEGLEGIEKKNDGLADSFQAFTRIFRTQEELLKKKLENFEFSKNKQKKLTSMQACLDLSSSQRVFREDDFECQAILEKMNSVTDRIHSDLPKSCILCESSFFSKSLPENSALSLEKQAKALQSENSNLKNQLRLLEEKSFFQSIEMKSNFEAVCAEKSAILDRFKQTELKLIEKNEKLLKIVENLEEKNLEKFSNFQDFLYLKEKLEEKIDELEKKLKNSEDEKSRVLKQLALKNQKLGNENEGLLKDLNKFKNKLELLTERHKKDQEKIQTGTDEIIRLTESLKEKQKNDCQTHSELADLESSLNKKNSEFFKLSETLEKTLNDLKEAKQKLKSLSTDHDSLKLLHSTESSVLKEKLGKCESQNQEYLSQLELCKSKISSLELSLSTNEPFQVLSRETSNQELKSLKLDKESLETENQSLIESQAFMTDYIKNMKNSYSSQLSSLSQKLEESQKQTEELSEALKCQTYLYNKQAKELNSCIFSPNPSCSSHPICRQKTSPSLDSIDLKSVETLKRLFEKQDLDISQVAMLGLELNEEDPSNFLSRITELKHERDTYYLAAQKYEDLINELKSELSEDDEFQILSRVISLKKVKI